MAEIAALRRIAAALPGAADRSTADQVVFRVDGRLFAWSALQRVHPKKARVPSLELLAVRCPMARKELLIEAAPDVYFDDEHYRGYEAVLVRLQAIDEGELAALLADACAWQAAKPKRRRKS